MCTPAEPKPTPAMLAPSIIAPRASRSSASCTARRRNRPPYSSALADHTSATGFEPWYGGRSSGVAGRSRRSYGREVGLGRVADDVQARRARDLGRQRADQLGVDDALGRAQVAV